MNGKAAKGSCLNLETAIFRGAKIYLGLALHLAADPVISFITLCNLVRPIRNSA